jgi:hypothetical protein
VIVIILPVESVTEVVGVGSPAAMAGGGARSEKVATSSTDRNLQIRRMALLDIASCEASVDCNLYLFYWCRLRGLNFRRGVISMKQLWVIISDDHPKITPELFLSKILEMTKESATIL